MALYLVHDTRTLLPGIVSGTLNEDRYVHGTIFSM